MSWKPLIRGFVKWSNFDWGAEKLVLRNIWSVVRSLAEQILGYNAVSFDNIVTCTAGPGHIIVHHTIRPCTTLKNNWVNFKWGEIAWKRLLSEISPWSQTLIYVLRSCRRVMIWNKWSIKSVHLLQGCTNDCDRVISSQGRFCLLCNSRAIFGKLYVSTCLMWKYWPW